jgi:hypothetical protein
VNSIVQTAREYLGFTARGNNSNTFAIDADITGTSFQWDGAFVDRVLKQANIHGTPKHTNTAAALSFYLRSGQTRKNPKSGDLVFFAFQTSSHTASFDGPHIGVVTDASRWRKDQTFRSVEAQISSGQPRASVDDNGVFERTRYATDVLTFVRLPQKTRRVVVEPADTPTDSEKELTTVRPAALTRCMNSQQAASAKPQHRKAVQEVQIALAAHSDIQLRNANRGVYDAKTRSAAAAFQRYIGRMPEACTGVLTVEDLQALSTYKNRVFFRVAD